MCVWHRLTVVTVAVPAAGYDHGVAQQVVTEQTEELLRYRVLLLLRLRLLLGEERRPLLLADGVRRAAGGQISLWLYGFRGSV